MTAYFDDRHTELRKITDAIKIAESEDEHGVAPYRLYDQVNAYDRALVWDVTLAAQSPGFPEAQRTAIHKLVLRYSAECQPVNSKGLEYETVHERIDDLHTLTWDLHSVFHEIAQMHMEGFSDDPRSPLRVLYAAGEEIREQLHDLARDGSKISDTP